jgi:hypothetical protein
MIINTQSSNTGKRLEAGWKEVTVNEVSIANNPNDMILYKVTVAVTNPEISNVLANGFFSIEIPVWNRQNSDGSYGGEYDLLNFYRATGAQEKKLEGNKTDIDLDSMKGRKLLVRFYNRPGSSYVDAHAKTALPSNADQGYKDLKEAQFQKDLAYMNNRYEAKLASSTTINSMINTPSSNKTAGASLGGNLDDKVPF